MNGRRFDPIDMAVAAIARGEIVVVADDENRENEGDLIMAADAVTEDHVAFFVRHTSGVICVGVSPERCDALALSPMVPAVANREAQGTAFTVSVDLRDGTTTGISAADRALTVRALADPSVTPTQLNRPGHVFPLRARAGGVLERPGHTEAAVDLARLAGRAPAGMLCELVCDDGRMARLDDLTAFARRHGMPLVSIADLIGHRRRTDPPVRRTVAARLPTERGAFRCIAFEDVLDPAITHLALVMGDVEGAPDVLVRVHSECLTGDLFGSVRCDCGRQLDESMRRIATEGCGVVVYLRGHEGRGIGITHKLEAYGLQDAGLDTVDANLELGLPIDSREYGAAGAILTDLGVASCRLLTNNPGKIHAIEGTGPPIASREPLRTAVHPEAARYLATKRARLGHLLSDPFDHAPTTEVTA